MPSPHYNFKLYRYTFPPHHPLQNSYWYLASHPTPRPSLEESLVCAPSSEKLHLLLCPLPHHFINLTNQSPPPP